MLSIRFGIKKLRSSVTSWISHTSHIECQRILDPSSCLRRPLCQWLMRFPEISPHAATTTSFRTARLGELIRADIVHVCTSFQFALWSPQRLPPSLPLVCFSSGHHFFRNGMVSASHNMRVVKHARYLNKNKNPCGQHARRHERRMMPARAVRVCLLGDPADVQKAEIGEDRQADLSLKLSEVQAKIGTLYY